MSDQSVETTEVENAEVAEVATPNVTLTKDVLEKHMKAFGRAFGRGANSRPAMAMEAVQAAATLADVSDKDAEALYTLFQQGVAASKGIEYKAESSFKVQVSKFKQFLQVGSLPHVDAVAVFDMAEEKIRSMAAMDENPLKGSAYDNLLRVARAQLKQPETPLSEAEIEGILTPTEEEKTALDKVISTYKRVRTLGDEIDSPNLVGAMESLGKVIGELGGEIPPEKAAKAQERQVAALNRQMKKAQAKLAALTGQTAEV